MWISLGGTCAVANYLRASNHDRIGSPFDWCKTDIKALNSVLRNDFAGFSELEVIKFSENHPYISSNIDIEESINNCGSLVLQNPYGIRFAHEILDKDMLLPFCQRLSQRIDNFRDLGNDNDNDKIPVFVRFEDGKLKKDYMENLIELFGLLSKIVKLFRFILIIHKDYQNMIDTSFFGDIQVHVVLYETFSADWKYLQVFNNTLLNNFDSLTIATSRLS